MIQRTWLVSGLNWMGSFHSLPIMHLLNENESRSVFRNEIGHWFKVVIWECALVVCGFFNVCVQVHMCVLSAVRELKWIETLGRMDCWGVILIHQGLCVSWRVCPVSSSIISYLVLTSCYTVYLFCLLWIYAQLCCRRMSWSTSTPDSSHLSIICQ